jgi:hypothetical protein
MGMAVVIMGERKWVLTSIIGKGRIVYYSASQKQFNPEHVRLERVGFEQCSSPFTGTASLDNY